MKTFGIIMMFSIAFIGGYTISGIVYGQNETAPTHSEVFANINTHFIETILLFIVAILPGVYGVAKALHVDKKAGVAFTLIDNVARAGLDNREMIRESSKAFYEASPEAAQRIMDKPLVKEVALDNSIREYQPKIEKIIELANKWGTVVDDKLKPVNEGG